jgi:hypothetical protein
MIQRIRAEGPERSQVAETSSATSARIRCDACDAERLVPSSCKGHGARASCNARRMVEVAAHLTDHVLPSLPSATLMRLRPAIAGRRRVCVNMNLPDRAKACPRRSHRSRRSLVSFRRVSCGAWPRQSQPSHRWSRRRWRCCWREVRIHADSSHLPSTGGRPSKNHQLLPCVSRPVLNLDRDCAGAIRQVALSPNVHFRHTELLYRWEALSVCENGWPAIDRYCIGRLVNRVVRELPGPTGHVPSADVLHC